MWPDQRLLDLFGIELPIIQAPMAGANGAAMASAVSAAGGLGSLPCAMLDTAQARSEIARIRASTTRPFNVNFFCHVPEPADPARMAAWKAQLAPYYGELGIDPATESPAIMRAPFDEATCALVEEYAPAVVSFHFGLPQESLLARVRTVGCRIISSATTVAEARWLEERGCDAIVAQGVEAGGHRGMFLDEKIATQVGTLALVPQVVDAVRVPVIAAGGIADGRGIAAALALGASGVQIGTAYLLTPEALISDLHRAALRDAPDDGTALTNLYSGRPARSVINRLMREIGPLSSAAPPFPTAGAALAPLKSRAEALGAADFSSLWSGQAGPLTREAVGSGELTRHMATETLQRLRTLAGTRS